MAKIAHISDLHIGKIKSKRLVHMCSSLLKEEIDYILVTGDITERGLKGEYKEFLSLFKQEIAEGRLIAVPGNHDRLGDDVAGKIMTRRVQVVSREQLYIICVDSTGPHNYLAPFASHGSVCDTVLGEIDQALNQAGPNQLVTVMMHHHPLPLPTESLLEFVSGWLKLPFAAELHLGQQLIDLILGRADLLLHGHKHIPSEFILPCPRPLQVCNAGCTPALERYRIFRLKDGQIQGSKWKYMKET